MFGVDANENAFLVRVCCGPRCGAESGHRAIYAAVERAMAARACIAGKPLRPVVVQPTMCRGFCGGGVTLALPDGGHLKLRDARDILDARTRIESRIKSLENERKPTCQP